MDVQRDSIKYCFTKYLETSVKRCRKDYLQKKYKIQKAEIQMEEEFNDICEFDEWDWLFCGKQTPWEVKDLKIFLRNTMSENIVEAQEKLRDIELLILCMRVFGQYSHREIAAIMHMSEQQAASVYDYAKKKLRKELKNGL